MCLRSDDNSQRPSFLGNSLGSPSAMRCVCVRCWKPRAGPSPPEHAALGRSAGSNGPMAHWLDQIMAAQLEGVKDRLSVFGVLP